MRSYKHRDHDIVVHLADDHNVMLENNTTKSTLRMMTLAGQTSPPPPLPPLALPRRRLPLVGDEAAQKDSPSDS